MTDRPVEAVVVWLAIVIAAVGLIVWPFASTILHATEVLRYERPQSF